MLKKYLQVLLNRGNERNMPWPVQDSNQHPRNEEPADSFHSFQCKAPFIPCLLFEGWHRGKQTQQVKKDEGCHTGVWESKPSASAASAAAAAASRPPGKKRESESLLYPCRKFSFYFSIFLWQRFQSKSGFLSSWFFKRPQSQGDIFAPTFVRVCWSLQLCRQQFFKV